MSDKSFTVLGIAGSLRRESYNRALLGAAQRLAPPGVTVERYERLGEIPTYNEDVRVGQGEPEPVRDLKARMAGASALLIATPEYNYGIPGVLKNAIDWASRPYGDNSWDGKPVAVMGASVGHFNATSPPSRRPAAPRAGRRPARRAWRAAATRHPDRACLRRR